MRESNPTVSTSLHRVVVIGMDIIQVTIDLAESILSVLPVEFVEGSLER